MTANSKIETLRTLLDTQIDAFNARRNRDKKKAIRARVAQALGGAVVTVLLGLNQQALGYSATVDARLKALALVVSASITVVAAWDAFFDHRSLWIRYAGVLAGLRALRAELDYITAEQSAANAKELDSLFHRTQALLESANQSWQQLRATERQPVPLKES